ncbi:MAG: SBBP repeat-containing protein [Bacteroidia bacterium]
MRIILLQFILLLTFNTNAQIWNWVNHGGSIAGNEIGNGIAIDDSGNTYITGVFFQTSTFGNFTLTSSGAQDIYVAKYDINGVVQWAKRFGGVSSDNSNKIAIDQSNNIYIVGSFNDSIKFDNTTLFCSWVDAFVAKLDPMGNAIWAKQGGGPDYFDSANDVSIDLYKNVIITGSFGSSSVSFGSYLLNNTSSAIHKNDLFIVKYDSSGNIAWVQHPSGLGNEGATRISIDSHGNIFTLMIFDSTITLANSTYNTLGSADMMFTKHDSSGTLIWSKHIGGTNYDLPYGISLDSQNNIYLTGGFSGSVNFGITTLTSAGIYNELFLAKYDSLGNELWIRKAGGAGNNVGVSVETDSQNNVYVANSFNGTSIFGSTTLISSGSSDIAISKYSSSGNLVWVAQAGGTDFDAITDMAVNSKGLIACTGRFRNTSSFGAYNISSFGNEDAWIAQLTDQNTVSIDENLNQRVTIFPNPFSEQTILKTSLFLNNASVIVYNLYGQAVKQINNITGQEIYLNRYNLSSGIYFIQLLQDKKEVITKKIIIAD